MQNAKHPLRIGIIAAMESEIKILRQALQTCQHTTIAQQHFYHGKLHGLEVVLLLSGIGKVNAAIGASLLIECFTPSHIINTGSAGGLLAESLVGDVVISSTISHHDVDMTMFGYEYGQVAKMPVTFVADSHLVSIAEQVGKQQQHINIIKGMIVTGDSFINSDDKQQLLRSRFPTAAAVEMEAAAIAQTCYQFDCPFIVIRSLSDIAGQESDISFAQFLPLAAKNSSAMVMAMVDSLSSKAA